MSKRRCDGCSNPPDEVAKQRDAETRKRVLMKSFREQDKRLFGLALVRAVRAAAKEYCFRDGFVEWATGMANEVDEWEEELKRQPRF